MNRSVEGTEYRASNELAIASRRPFAAILDLTSGRLGKGHVKTGNGDNLACHLVADLVWLRTIR